MTALDGELDALALDLETLERVHDELARLGDMAAIAGRPDVDPGRLASVALLSTINRRLARLEAKFDEYEPLIEMVRQRADRGTWRERFGGKTT